MISTYTVSEYTESDTQVDVVYTNDAGLTHTKSIRIPRNGEGEVEQEVFCEILAGQLLSLNSKLSLGVVGFTTNGVDYIERG
tara:strand:- start:474 stop:719 length:246 start_codon:yes stop_codon:yes gene_type:complete